MWFLFDLKSPVGQINKSYLQPSLGKELPDGVVEMKTLNHIVLMWLKCQSFLIINTSSWWGIIFTCVSPVSHQVPLMLVIDLYMGDNVRLPCESQPFEMHEPTVMWSRDDLSPSIVHQRQQDGDQIKDQNQLYRGRTWMRTDALTKGDLGLNLTALILSDSGNYTCSVRSSEGKTIAANIELRVKGQ